MVDDFQNNVECEADVPSNLTRVQVVLTLGSRLKDIDI